MKRWFHNEQSTSVVGVGELIWCRLLVLRRAETLDNGEGDEMALFLWFNEVPAN